MDKEQKQILAHEIRTNMNLTKEQYIEMCRLINGLDLEPGRVETLEEEKTEDWEDIERTFKH